MDGLEFASCVRSHQMYKKIDKAIGAGLAAIYTEVEQ